jgi:hypothetical protein
MSHWSLRQSLVFSPVYTIVDARNKRTFGLSNGKNTEKTSLVGFTQRTDAIYVARALERFRVDNDRWPYSHSDGETRDSLLHLKPPTINVRRLAWLDLRAYDTVNDLAEECKATFLDLCLCIQVRRGTTIQFVGKHIELETDSEAFRASSEFALDLEAPSTEDSRDYL